jgi:hypothetical protein
MASDLELAELKSILELGDQDQIAPSDYKLLPMRR